MGYEVRLRYHRDECDTCTGDLSIAEIGDDHPEAMTSFEKKAHKNVIYMLSTAVKSTFNVERVIFQRTDRTGLLPIQLDEATVHLLKTDPLAAIRALSWGNTKPVVVDLSAVRKAKETAKQKVTSTTLLPKSVFVAAREGLSEAFGDVLHVVLHEGSAECPFCGRWTKQRRHVEGLFHCDKCRMDCPIVGVHQRWLTFSVEALLATPATRFYFPFGWNPTFNWITKESLNSLYEAWQIERKVTS